MYNRTRRSHMYETHYGNICRYVWQNVIIHVCTQLIKYYMQCDSHMVAAYMCGTIKYYMRYDSHMVAAYMCGTIALLHVSIRMYGIVIRMKHCVTYYRPVGGSTRLFYVRIISDVSGTYSECASI